jgi:hypothetical protein
LVFAILYGIIRVGYTSSTGGKKGATLQEITHDIWSYFMKGVLPGVKSKLSIEELNTKLHDFSHLIQIHASKSRWYKSAIFVILGIVLFVAGLFLRGTLHIANVKIPGGVQAFAPIFLFLISLFLVVMGVVQQTLCGVHTILSIKKFFKRWGLRLLMLALDLLYIPILTVLITQITPAWIEFEVGRYQHVNFTGSDFDMVESHRAGQMNCSGWTDEGWKGNESSVLCEEMCGGGSVMFLLNDSSLFFFRDVLQTNGPTMAYTFLFVMIGIPLLYYFMVERNRNFVFNINVFGRSMKEKWTNTIRRMHTTGIFLFAEYKATRSTWSVKILLLKFFSMLISTLSINLWDKFRCFLPIPYLVMCIALYRKKPYLHTTNNILDTVLYLINFLFTTVPVLALFGIHLPALFGIVLTVLVFVIPIIALIILLCRAQDEEGDEADLTFMNREMAEDIEDAREHLEKMSQSESDSESERRGRELEIIDDDDEGLDIFNDEENEVEIEPDHLDTIRTSMLKKDGSWKQVKKAEKLIDVKGELKRQKRNGESHRHKKGCDRIKVNKYLLAKRFTMMFQFFDTIVDGETIEFLLSVLQVTVLAAAACFGYYLSGLIDLYPTRALEC